MHLQVRQAPPPAQTVGSFKGTSTAATSFVETSLLFNTAASETAPADISAPLVQSSTIIITSTPTSTPTSSSSSSSNSASSASGVAGANSASKQSIPIGAVVGACLGAFALLVLALVLFAWSSRRTRRQQARPQSRLMDPKGGPWSPITDKASPTKETWVKMEEQKGASGILKSSGDERRDLDHEHIVAEASGSGGANINRSLTTKTAATAVSFNTTYGYGAGLGLSKTFSDVPQLEFTNVDMGKGRTEMSHDHTSWDGETVADESFLSLKDEKTNSFMSGQISPSTVLQHQTPPATHMSHQWEEAELISGEEDAYGGMSGSEERTPPAHQSKNPFLNIPSSNNPFTDANAISSSSPISPRDTASIRSSDTVAREYQAMQSLLAALNIPQDEARARLSVANLATPRQSIRQSVQSQYSQESPAPDSSQFPPVPSGPRS